MAKTVTLKQEINGVEHTLYPQTVPSQVVDPETGRSMEELWNLDRRMYEVVTSLPLTNIQEGKLYLVQTSTPGTYTQYVWNGATWTNLGNAAINLVVEDTLNSGSTTTGLSANQGRELNFKITGQKSVKANEGWIHYKDGYLLKADSSQVGKDIDDVPTLAQSGRYNVKIPVSGMKAVEFYCFTSSNGYGCLIVDSNDVVLAAYTRTTGETITATVPEGAAYLLYSTSDINTTVTLYGDSVIPKAPTNYDIVASGTLLGNGTELVDFEFPISKGDYLHIDFPNGDWQTVAQADTYLKVYVLLKDKSVSPSVNRLALKFAFVGWTVPNYGYDVYASPAMGVSYDTGVLRIRAASGVQVPFVIRRLSKEVCKPYFMDEISISANSIAARQGNASLTLAMIADMHYRSLHVYSNSNTPLAPFSPLGAIMSIKEMSRRVRLDNVVCLGDSIEGRQTAAIAKSDAGDITEFFSRTGVPLLYTVGNHDDNRYYNQDDGDRMFTQKEIYAKYIQPVDERTTIGGAMNGCNYYRDIDRHKVRCISLMSNDFAGNYSFTPETRTWLTNTLNSMPEGYKAVIFTHIPLPASHNWSSTGAYTGGEATAAIIAENNDKVICVFDGHLHVDNVYVKPYISVNMCCQKVYNSASGTNNPGSSAPEGAWWPIREAGTKNEILWDAVVINQEEGLLSCIRVGAGVDRYIHYNPIEVAPGGTTTLTPAAITADSWAVLDSEASAISIADGVVTVDASATVGSRLMAKAVDANGNFEYWCIKVVAGS